MDDYIKRQRYTKVDRQRGGITSHRILEIRGNNLIIGAPKALSTDEKISVPVSDTSGFKIGDYLDFVFCYTLTDGRTSSYQTRFLGKTPPQFIPADGETYTR